MNVRALPAPSTWTLPPLPVAALWLTLGLANVWFGSWTLAEMLLTDSAADWAILSAPDYAANYRWSPLLIPVLEIVTMMPLLAWRLLHVVAALAMPTWPMRLLVLASWPFWFDVSLGNVLVFLVLAAAWALRGSTLAAVAFLALTLLIPRPLMIPVAAWLLWRRPDLRLPFLGLAAVLGAATLATGLTGEWVAVLFGSTSEIEWMFNVGPSRWLGAWWLLLGIPLAVWLTWKGRVGLASLAVSPYLLPYYLLFGLLHVEPIAHQAAPELGRRVVERPDRHAIHGDRGRAGR